MLDDAVNDHHFQLIICKLIKLFWCSYFGPVYGKLLIETYYASTIIDGTNTFYDH